MNKINELTRIYKVISDPVRLGILLVLYGSRYIKKSKHSLTFSELRTIMEIPYDAVLNNHLKKLIEAGLVVKRPSQKSPSSRIKTEYEVTDKWINFLQKTGLAEYLDAFIKEKLK